MDTGLSPEDEAFRQEVRTFLRENLPEDIHARWKESGMIFPDKPDAVRWQKILAEKGWIAPAWPVEYGGTGWTTMQKYIFETETASYGAPPVIPLGLRMVAPVIMKYGTSEQKAHFLPRILATDDYWCQGYSEPGSGSDLASLKTRAVADDDDYVVNGSKIWTTHAQFADWMFCLVRTSDEPKRQNGITFLLIPMDTPGVDIRPIITLGGHHEVNQVFLDDVRVSQSNRVGPEGDGWTVAKYLLEFERGGGFASGRIALNMARLKRMADVNGLNDDSSFKRKLSDLEIQAETIAISELRMLSKLKSGENPGADASIIKLRGSEVNQNVTELSVEAAGLFAMPFEQLEAMAGDNRSPSAQTEAEAGVSPRYFNYRANTIFGGTSEVQKGILAKVSLGL